LTEGSYHGSFHHFAHDRSPMHARKNAYEMCSIWSADICGDGLRNFDKVLRHVPTMAHASGAMLDLHQVPLVRVNTR